MTSRRFALLGQSGLLGQAVRQRAENLSGRYVGIDRKTMPNLEHLLRNPDDFLANIGLRAGDLLLNAVGRTKQLIDESDPKSVNLARWLNSELPKGLAHSCANAGIDYLQIGTDCIFSGKKGAYVESDMHDAEDVYGQTKSIGESSINVNVLRTSFVGPTSGANAGLWGWIRDLEPGSKIDGYVDHFWNGVTTDVLARILVAGFEENFSFHGVQHLVPADFVSKFQLVSMITKRLGRTDLIVNEVATGEFKNMTLSTNNVLENERIWRAAGFSGPLSISEAINLQYI